MRAASNEIWRFRMRNDSNQKKPWQPSGCQGFEFFNCLKLRLNTSSGPANPRAKKVKPIVAEVGYHWLIMPWIVADVNRVFSLIHAPPPPTTKNLLGIPQATTRPHNNLIPGEELFVKDSRKILGASSVLNQRLADLPENLIAISSRNLDNQMHQERGVGWPRNENAEENGRCRRRLRHDLRCLRCRNSWNRRMIRFPNWTLP